MPPPPSRPPATRANDRAATEPAAGATAQGEAGSPVVGIERGWAARWVGRALAHAPVALPSLAVLLAGSAALAAGWYAVSRLGYILYVGAVLRAVARRGPPADHGAREQEWRRFRRIVSWVMDNDASAFVALCLVTRGTLRLAGPAWPAVAVGTLLTAGGLAAKAWATASLPPGSYYWRNFFFPGESRRVSQVGPYRWLSDPMYSVGYAPLYGVALIGRSVEGLVAAAVAQALVLLLAALVERPALDRG